MDQKLEMLTEGTVTMVTEHYDIVEVKTKDSRSGANHDHKAVTTAYVNAFKERKLGSESNSWKDKLTNASYDGAMIGEKNGGFGELRRRVGSRGELILSWAVAHKLELSVGDAAKGARWFRQQEKILRAMYRRWKTSPLKAAKQKEVAVFLEDVSNSLKGLHGIRWMASKLAAVIALEKGWRVQVALLHHELVNSTAAIRDFVRGSQTAGSVGLSLASEDEDFLHVEIKKHFICRNKQKLCRGEVVSKKDRANRHDDKEVTLFKIEYSDFDVEDLNRAQLIEVMDRPAMRGALMTAKFGPKPDVGDFYGEIAQKDDIDPKDKTNDAFAYGKKLMSIWDAYTVLTSGHFLAITYFQIDLLLPLKMLSLTFQKDNLVFSEIPAALRECVRELSKLVEPSAGLHTSLYISGYKKHSKKGEGHEANDDSDEEGDEEGAKEEKGVYKNTPIYGHARGLSFVNERREKLVGALVENLNERFEIEEGGIWELVAIFEHTDWDPAEDEFVAEYGKTELSDILEKYAVYFPGVAFRNSLFKEWEKAKDVFPTKQFFAKPFEKMWDYVHENHFEDYKHLLLLVLFFRVVLLDTSGNERGFSFMNLIKNRLRSLLSTQELRDSMTIVASGPKLRDNNNNPNYGMMLLHRHSPI